MSQPGKRLNTNYWLSRTLSNRRRASLSVRLHVGDKLAMLCATTQNYMSTVCISQRAILY
nr:MAG TPA: hypothetical protein [Caudoviricetes sp.]